MHAKMMVWCAGMTLASALAVTARADDGKFPLLRAGLVGGVSEAPIPRADADYPDDDLQVTLGAGVQMVIDARVAVVQAEGVFNFLGGGVEWTGRGEVVVGKRFSHNLVLGQSQSRSGNTVTTTTYYDLGTKMPMILGGYAGASVMRIGESSHANYADPTMPNVREPATLPVIDAGFKVLSPQIETSIGPAFDLETASSGLRWVFGMAFPLGRMPLFFRASGDHFFGDDPDDNSGRRVGYSMLLSLGLGSPIR